MADVDGKCPHCGMYCSRFFMKTPYGKIRMKCEPSGYLNTDKPENKYCGRKFAIKVKIVHEVMKK
jgi:hypothetical protein